MESKQSIQKTFNEAQKQIKKLWKIQNKLSKLTTEKGDPYNRSLRILPDFVEAYACDRFNLKLSKNRNEPGYDCIDDDNKKYQIKYTVLKSKNGKERFSSYINNLKLDKFDYLIIVILNEKYEIKEVYKIPSNDLRNKKLYKFLSKDETTFKIGQAIEELRSSEYKVKR